MRARVHITLKPGVLDPQGKAIEHTLARMGFAGVDGVRQGKYLELDLAETDPAAARRHVRAPARQHRAASTHSPMCAGARSARHATRIRASCACARGRARAVAPSGPDGPGRAEGERGRQRLSAPDPTTRSGAQGIERPRQDRAMEREGISRRPDKRALVWGEAATRNRSGIRRRRRTLRLGGPSHGIPLIPLNPT